MSKNKEKIERIKTEIVEVINSLIQAEKDYRVVYDEVYNYLKSNPQINDNQSLDKVYEAINLVGGMKIKMIEIRNNLQNI